MFAVSTFHAVVYGRVQGVGFRDFVRRRARALSVAGWVRNLPDGTVEVRAEGPKDALLSLMSALHEGPVGSRVTRVDFLDPKPARVGPTFEVF